MKELVQTIDWNDDTIHAFWDFYSQYPELYFTYQYGDKIVDALMPFIKTKSLVLDYGCGTGFLMKSLIGKSFTVYGTDSSIASLNTVQEKFGHENNFGGILTDKDIISDKKYEGFFDVVCLIEVVEHLPDRQLNAVIANIKKLLKKNGTVLITTPNEEDLAASFVYCPLSGKVFHRWQHVRNWSDSSLESYLLERGFETLKVFSTDFSEKKAAPTIRSLIKENLRRIGLLKKPNNKAPHLVYIGINS